MLNVLWIGMLGASLLFSFFAGTSARVAGAVFEACTSCISFVMKTGAVMVMWSGFMAVAESGGLTRALSSLMSPAVRRIFPGIAKNSREELLVSSNLAANMLGLSNAATPLGMEAMRELSRRSRGGVATDDMCMLAVVNCASLQLVPSTLIAMRSAAGSVSPADITLPIWIASLATLIFAVTITKIWAALTTNT